MFEYTLKWKYQHISIYLDSKTKQIFAIVSTKVRKNTQKRNWSARMSHFSLFGPPGGTQNRVSSVRFSPTSVGAWIRTSSSCEIFHFDPPAFVQILQTQSIFNHQQKRQQHQVVTTTSISATATWASKAIRNSQLAKFTIAIPTISAAAIAATAPAPLP